MQTKIVLATLFAAASVSAEPLALMPRQTSGGAIAGLSKTCTDDLKSAQDASAPTPPPQLIQSYVSAVQGASDPCHFTPSGGLASSLASYESQASSWADANKDIASKIEKDCSVDLSNLISMGVAACTQVVSAISSDGASKSAGASGSGATATGSPAATVKPNGAAANGAAAAGALMVGVLGAVLML